MAGVLTSLSQADCAPGRHRPWQRPGQPPGSEVAELPSARSHWRRSQTSPRLFHSSDQPGTVCVKGVLLFRKERFETQI